MRTLLVFILSFVFCVPVYAASASVRVSEDGAYRIIESNGIPNHTTGHFPNSGNPNTISAQHYTFRVPLHPSLKETPSDYGHDLFGVALNGVPFDPGTAEFWNNDRSSGWNYEALSGKINLGIDQNHAHVQPGGAYHYHGIPDGLLKNENSPGLTLIGYAADGFPIYYSPAEKSGYRVKKGVRPSGPGGVYDGSFVQDYEFVQGLGTLDVCNGSAGPAPEYPEGIYRYFLTKTFPFVPRCLRGTADSSFHKAHPHGSAESSGPQQGGGMRNPGMGAGGRGGPMGPPPEEAIRACSGKQEGSSCGFQTPRGAVQGTCRRVPEGSMACVPQGRP